MEFITGSKAIFNMFGGTINNYSFGSNDNSYGIRNSGTINITGGNINSRSSRDSYGIYNSNAGVVNIGTKGDGIVSSDTPSILSENTITSNEDYGGYGIYNINATLNFYDGKIEGSTRAITEDSKVTEVEETQKPQYSEDYKIYAYGIEAIDVAKIGNKTYSSLQNAINDAIENDVIEILRGIQYTNQDVNLTIPSNKNVTIDLQNHPIVSAIEDSVFTVEGNLTIIDTIGGENGKIVSSYNNTVNVKQDGILEMSGGTISNNKNTSIYNQGFLNIINGTISSEQYGVENEGTMTIQGGHIEGSTAIRNIKSAILNIEDGIIESNNYYASQVILNIDNAVLNMVGGFIQKSSNYNSAIIRNSSTETVNIYGGTLYSIANYSDDYAYSIYSTAGTVNIGTKDGKINNEKPNIFGTTSGIYISKDSTLNIYDGIIKGEDAAINGDIILLENMSELLVGKETDEDGNTYETISLVQIDSPIASVNGTEYYNLKDAIDSISGTGTVSILREGTVGHSIDIPDDKEITIDLNGNTLHMYTPFENNGTLKITDSSSGSGILTGYKDRVVNNNGTFELIGGNISNLTYGIYNNNGGTINISGGTLSDNEYGIYNVSGGTVNVTNGTITGNTYGTFNYGGETNVSGGNITGNEYGVYNSSGTTNISNLTITGNTTEICNGETGTTNILSGNIIGNTSPVTNTSSGRINIGTQDAGYNSNSPIIQGEEYGIVNTGSGTIAFYDGTIKGKVGSIQGYYLYTETGYKAQTNIIDGYYCDTLALSGTVTTIAKIGDIEYTNLQSAINACTSSTPTTITLVNSVNSNLMFTVEEGQNIIIDLNGCTITSSSLETLMQNAGTLTIIDTSDRQTGKVTNNSGVAINSTGTLTLGQDDETVSTVCPEISGSSTGIVTTGTFNFYDGIIKGATALEGTVTSRPNGYVINSSTDQASGYDQLVLGR